jgi:methylated-DNA-[protein]-cysteine S-methyltransferase
MNRSYALHACPLGELLLVAHELALTEVHLRHGKHVPPLHEAWTKADDHPILHLAKAELDAYFAGRLHVFTVPIQPFGGTPFQQGAWSTLLQIPFGETRTYAQQAALMGKPSATRAVGAANGRNPICIIIPCHRVIGSNGSLTGYAGGVEAKRTLLALEAAAGPNLSQVVI